MPESSPSTVFEVRVELKPGILDAEAENVKKTLSLLGITELNSVGTARLYVLDFGGASPARAEELARRAVDRLLANPVIHYVTITPRSR
ncbi:MAG: phosphoribosylformylglycinamidine synthase subunit PurS [Thermoplasmata archaeon]